MRRRAFFFAVGPFGPVAFFISLSRGRVAAGVQQKKRSHHMANKNTNPGIGKNANPGVCGYIVLRVLPMARWDVWDARDAWDNGFLKFALRAPRRIWPHHRQGVSRLVGHSAKRGASRRNWPHHRQGVSHRDLASHEFYKGFCRGLGAWELRQVMLFRKSERRLAARRILSMEVA